MSVSTYDTSLSGNYLIRNKFSGLYFNVTDGAVVNSTNINQWEYNGYSCQEFTLTYVSDGYYTVKCVNSDGAQAVDVSGLGTSDGTNIQTYSYNGGSSQLFKFQKQSDGTYVIFTKVTNDASCLDNEGWATANGGNIAQYSYGGYDCQKWWLIATDTVDQYGPRVDVEESVSYTTGSGYVQTKYSGGMSEAASTTQTDWHTANCHDPKLFQDDDGTYYVYSTDAACGNSEHVGLTVRSSKDLVNWTTHDHSAIYGYWDESMLYWEGFNASSNPDTVHSNTSYTASTWAPTVIKQNDLYYMYHGFNTTSGTSAGKSDYICLAIASSAKGPFYPASYISSYSGGKADVLAIQKKLKALGVTYTNNALVRYARSAKSCSAKGTPALNGTAVSSVAFSESDNGRFGCIDPEFVFEITTGKLMEYTVGTNTCYAMTYGSWLNGIALCYVDKVSLKPIYYDYAGDGAKTSITVDGTTYTTGDELNCSLDKANYVYYGKAYKGNYGCLGVRIAGGYGAAYEGAQLIHNATTGYYYLFVSMGTLDYEYRVGVGRSKNLTKNYVDAKNTSMLLTNSSSDKNYYANYHNIGSKIIGGFQIGSEYSYRCQGGQSILRNASGDILFANHTRTNFQAGYYFYLQVHKMMFNGAGWPVLNMNEYYQDTLTSLTLSDIAGTYDMVHTITGTGTSSFTPYGGSAVTYNTYDETPTTSKSITIDSSGNITGNYKGTLTLGSDGYSISIKLKSSSGATLGTFKGFVMNAVDYGRGASLSSSKTIHITSLCASSTATSGGCYFFGNKR